MHLYILEAFAKTDCAGGFRMTALLHLTKDCYESQFQDTISVFAAKAVNT